MKQPKTKSALIMSAISLLLCCAMLVGTTFAWFTDTASSGVNRIQAGNLDIDLLMKQGNDYVSIAGGTGDIFKEALTANNSNATLWEPGKTQIAKLAVENKGSLAVKYIAYIDVTDEGLVGALEYAMISSKTEIDTSSFTNWAGVKAAIVAAGGATGDVQAGRVAITTGVLDEVAKGTQNERDYVLLVVHMKENAGNEYQGMDALIDVNIVASQKDAELDSFSNTYDAEATLPTVPERLNGSGVSGGIRKSSTQGQVTVTPTGSGTEGAATEKVTIDVKMETNEQGQSSDTQTIGGATVPAPAAIAVMDTVFADSTVFEVISTTETQSKVTDDVLTLTLNVETVEAKAASIKLDISMDAKAVRTVTVKEVGQADVVTEQKKETPVTELSQPVTVEVQLDAGLEDVAVTHTHGTTTTSFTKAETLAALTNEKFFYDKATGLLTLKTDKFSEFEISYVSPEVCRIGTTPYATLQDAVDAAKSGDTIVMTKDCTVTGLITFPADKTLTLNLNGKKVTTVGNAKGLWSEVNGTLTVIGDGYLGDTTHEETGYIFYVYGTLNLNSSAKFESGLEVAEMKAAESKLYISDGYYVGDTYDNRYWNFNKLDKFADSALIEITGGTFENFNPANAETEAPAQNWVKKGYKATPDNETAPTKWTVAPKPVDNFEVKISKTGENDTYMSLAGFRNSVNAGTTYEGYTVTLQKNVNLDNDDWIPIGLKENNKPFKGIFDGAGKTISGLYINTSGAVEITGFSAAEDYWSLFGLVGEGGTVKDLTVEGSVTADNACGVVGRLDGGTVSNVTNKVTVTGLKKAGGVVVLAQLNATISGCKNSGAVALNVQGSNRSIGGIVALVNSPVLVSDCVNEGAITTTGSNAHYVGGIVGWYQDGDGENDNTNLTLTVADCTNKGNISTATTGNAIGGIVGKIGSGAHKWTGYTAFEDCKNEGNLTGSGSSIGDIFGSIADVAASGSYSGPCKPGTIKVYGTLTVRSGKQIGGNYNLAYNRSETLVMNPVSENFVNPTPDTTTLPGYDIYTGVDAHQN